MDFRGMDVGTFVYHCHILSHEDLGMMAIIPAANGLLNSDSEKATRSDPSLILLLQLRQAGLIPPYVLFSLGGPGIARDYDAFRANNSEKLREYLEKFVVAPLNGGTPR